MLYPAPIAKLITAIPSCQELDQNSDCLAFYTIVMMMLMNFARNLLNAKRELGIAVFVAI